LNYVDDSGLQVADIIAGFKYEGFSEEPPHGKKFADYCGEIFNPKVNAKCESD